MPRTKSTTLIDILLMVGQNGDAHRALRALAVVYEAHATAVRTEADTSGSSALGPFGLATLGAAQAARHFASSRLERAGYGGEQGAPILAAMAAFYGLADDDATSEGGTCPVCKRALAS